MKKLLVVLCALALTATACGNKEEAVNNAEATTQEATENQAAEKSDDATESAINLDEYIGDYVNEETGEVTINKDGDSYAMSVTIYGLANMDEGQVMPFENGVAFYTIDPSGSPMTLSFCKTDDESYTLKVESSSWANLENGTEYEDFHKDNADAAVQGTSDLEDGVYYTTLSNEPAEYAEEYATSFMLESDHVAVDASFSKIADDGFTELETFEKKVYNIAIDGNTKFLAGGGEGEPQYMSATEFNDYIEQCMGSGLGLNIIIKNGVAEEIGIWS